jgi:hypothetical protein
MSAFFLYKSIGKVSSLNHVKFMEFNFNAVLPMIAIGEKMEPWVMS